jgi:AbrB family looped-hinge helix DNA binding protein
MKHLEQFFRLAGTTTVGPKGQVVIPAEVREDLGIRPGDKLIAIQVHGKNVVAFMTEEQAQGLINKLGSKLTGFSAGSQPK